MDEIQIPKKVELQTKLENEKIVLSKGSTTIIVGANGTGKTRLAVYIEEQLKEKAHRISAHRALKLNPNVNKIPEKSAKTYLSYGQNWDGIDVSNRKIIDGIITHILIYSTILIGYYNIYSLNKIILR